MKLYDNVIASVNSLCQSMEKDHLRDLPIVDTCWTDCGKNNLIFRQDMAYELGGSTPSTHALGMTAVTEEKSALAEDQILLIGKDLPDINSDLPYARIAVVKVKEGTLGEGNALYQAIKRMEYVRYHVNPEGFMTRVSLMNGRESARVSREAIKKGLNFSIVGSMMLKEYHKNPSIEAVKLIFITDPAFPMKELKTCVWEADKITRAIDHILKQGMTDCNTCSLQKVCEEVEGMRELHFGISKETERKESVAEY